MSVLYDSWKDVPEEEWHWENFTPREISCRGTGRLLLNDQAMDMIQLLRYRVNKPIILVSAYRSPEHNKAVGGARFSKHMRGEAFDVSMVNHDPAEFLEDALDCGFLGVGYYHGMNFLHIDLGPKRTWGHRWF